MSGILIELRDTNFKICIVIVVCGCVYEAQSSKCNASNPLELYSIFSLRPINENLHNLKNLF